MFYRVWNSTDAVGRFDWVKDPATVLKSPDWDKDVVLGVSQVHYQVYLMLRQDRDSYLNIAYICTMTDGNNKPQSFGASVALDSYGMTQGYNY